jgi:hypothetical protein
MSVWPADVMLLKLRLLCVTDPMHFVFFVQALVMIAIVYCWLGAAEFIYPKYETKKFVSANWH